MDTLEVHITLEPRQPWSEILVAELSELGFDSFVDTETGILAYGAADLNVDEILEQTSLNTGFDGSFSVEQKVIPHQNWNAQWEADFHPVYVEEYATILAPFHDATSAVGNVVIIQPQMSFGTGHHQTTWMLTKALFEMGPMPGSVLDMGTGTGVLAIVAEQLGARSIFAVDIEEWSAENARENALRNGCKNIEVAWGDVDLIGERTFGLILANINKNVLKAHMETYARQLETNGALMLSGFFNSDVPEMEAFCAAFGLSVTKRFQKEEWAAIQLTKTN